jgi:hypothetical protein
MVVLLVEPDHDVIASRALVLSRSGYMVATASSQSAVFHLRWMSGIYLVILSDTLGLPGLRSAAGYVRALWPSARIVLLGIAPSALEVHLYDEVVDHRVQPENLLDRVAKLSEAPWNQRPRAISRDPGASPCPDNGWLTLRTVQPEFLIPGKRRTLKNTASIRRSGIRRLSGLERGEINLCCLAALAFSKLAHSGSARRSVTN